MTSSVKKKIYFIVGPTASGKTTLSIELAKKINTEKFFDKILFSFTNRKFPKAEVISADSRQIFRGFDLSSGKVTRSEMENIPHHMLDIIDPGSTYSAVYFTNDALKKIEEIYSRGNIPIVCGGTGFYIDSLLYIYNLPKTKVDQNLRKLLNHKNQNELFEIVKTKDPDYAKVIEHNLETRNNKHRMMRIVEVINDLGKFPKLKKIMRFSPKEYIVKIIQTDISRQVLRKKIYDRIIIRLEQGMIEEIQNVKVKYDLSYEYLESLGLEFKWIARFLQNKISKEEMIENLYTETCQYAKRQDTWFRRYENDREIM